MDLAEDLRTILDHQNSWIYVVDMESHELLFINDKTYRLAPDSRLGMSCHEAFFKNDKPCQRCPMKQVEDKINYTMEVYNPVLKVWSSADASRIHWGGKDACLLCCHDITCYKKAEENSANQ